MNASEFTRRAILKHVAVAGLGATSALLWTRQLTAAACVLGDRIPGTAWNSAVLTAHHNATVIAISALIIPETETPGATSANVNRLVDAVLADAAPEERGRFLGGLSWIDARSHQLYGTDFIAATHDQHVALLESLSRNDPPQEVIGVEFFWTIKSLTIRGYYTSEAVLREELGENGNRSLERA